MLSQDILQVAGLAKQSSDRLAAGTSDLGVGADVAVPMVVIDLEQPSVLTQTDTTSPAIATTLPILFEEEIEVPVGVKAVAIPGILQLALASAFLLLLGVALSVPTNGVPVSLGILLTALALVLPLIVAIPHDTAVANATFATSIFGSPHRFAVAITQFVHTVESTWGKTPRYRAACALGVGVMPNV